MATGLVFGPEQAKVVVGAAPVSGLSFSQAQVTVSGKVKCISTPCAARILVDLNTAGSATTYTAEVASDGSFSIAGLNPGSYSAAVVLDAWCWKRAVRPVVVKTTDVTNVDFEQSG
eukprot:7085850-Pyramimonas_sp.AAC.1